MSIFEMSLAACTLIIVIATIRLLALNKLSKSFFVALWGIAACRLLIPLKISSSFSIFNAFNKVITEFQPIAETKTIYEVTNYSIINTIPQVMPSLRKAITISPLEIIWLIGVVGIAIIFTFAYFKNYAELKTAFPIKNNSMLEQWRSKQNLLRPFKILVSDKITTPVAFGIVKPKIILPKSMNLNDEQLLQYVLAHELQHIKHFDMFWKIILVTVVCIHWFNPLVWAMYVLANRDLELSCDEKVIRQFGEVTKSTYALSLINMAEQRSKFTPLYNGFSKNVMEERIVSIMKYKKMSVVALILSLIMSAGITTVFATSARATSDRVTTDETPQIPYRSQLDKKFGINDPKNIARDFEIYKSFGLTHNLEYNRLYFNGELVRYFEDIESKTSYKQWAMPDGSVDVYAVRDSAGTLTGIAKYSQSEFIKRTGIINNYVHAYTHSITKSINNSTSDGKLESQLDDEFFGESYGEYYERIYGAKYSQYTPILAKAYEVYEPYGLIYNSDENRLYYEGELVKYFEDFSDSGIGTSNNRYFGPYQDGDISVFVQRDANGILTSLEVRTASDKDGDGVDWRNFIPQWK